MPDNAGAAHVAIVTGASRGIGRAIAQRLAADGIRVAAVSRTLRPGDGSYSGSLEETVAGIEAAGGSAIAIAADLADPSLDRSEIVAAAANGLGADVDIVVNNAAGVRNFDLTFENMTAEMFRQTLEVNVWAAWELAMLAVPGMRRRGAGWILNISSQGASPRIGPPFQNGPPIFGQCLYGGSKAMLDRVTTGAAAELWADGIAVNTLAPEGAVATENAMTVANVTAAQSEPLETMAEAALALCTADPREVTGWVTYSLSLLVELGRSVRTLDGSGLVSGWQPDEIDPARLTGGYLIRKVPSERA